MGALAALALQSIFTSAASGSSGGSAIPPWRPPQWNTQSSTNPIPFTLTATDPTTNLPTVYVFDVILGLDHTQRAEVTENPVQTGAKISDHIYIIPPTLVAKIKMSESMQSYIIGQWADAPTKSVSAFQTLLSLQASKQPMQVATALTTYSNMLITDIFAPQDKSTLYGAKFVVTLRQVITANIQVNSTPASINDSERPQSTASTVIGQTPTSNVPAAITAQNNIANSPINLSSVPQVPGAGQWSSLPVSGLSNILP